MKLTDIPLVLPLAEWIWGTSMKGDGVSPDLCLSQIPLLGMPCFTQLVTKALGVAIILGSMLNKVPIMINMLRSQSAAGISRNSLYGEAIVYANGAMYGYLHGHPFTAYGENASLLFQNMILIGLTWKFLNTNSTKVSASPGVNSQEQVFVIVGFIVYVMAVLYYLPQEYQYLLMSATWPVMLYARGSQVVETYNVKHTGNLSIVTTSMNLVGSLIRIFTSINETGDIVVLAGYILSGGLSFIMFLQYWLYLTNTMELTSKEEDESKKKKES